MPNSMPNSILNSILSDLANTAREEAGNLLNAPNLALHLIHQCLPI